ncbi:hypothetical protein GCM10027596_01280 [Nocardioides korecus]
MLPAVLLVLVLLIVGGGAALALRGGRGPTTAPPPSAAPSTSAVPTPTPTSSPTAIPTTTTPSPTPSPTASPSATTFAKMYEQMSDGVIRVETTACDGGGVGSGFLVAPNLVATVAHVVEGSVSIALRQGSTITTGTVVGMDRQADLALVRLQTPMTGHVFTLDPAQPEVGTDVGAIGYPLGGPESLTKGSVSGLDRTIDVGNGPLRGLIQTDTGINPGNSGGPLLDTSGTVVGLVDAKNAEAAGIGFAIPTSTARAAFDGWRASPQSIDTGGHCELPTAPEDVDLHVNDHTDDPDGPGIAEVFTEYGQAINSGDYEAAYALLSSREQGKIPFQSFADGNATSFIVSFDMDSARDAADGAKEVSVRFTSVQDPSMGAHHQGCSAWTMTYTMVDEGEGWRVDRARSAPGSPAAC